ncbi:MAG: MraY family glycosyltransferase [Alphaproteobacteria bacterium]
MPLAIIASLILLAIALATAIAVGFVRQILLRCEILDHPNERSSHVGATPRGGGLALMAILLPAWLIAVVHVNPTDCSWQIAAGALCLAGISWLDDLRGVGPMPRLLVQIVVAAVAVAVLKAPVFQGLLPPLFDSIAAIFLLVWFINLFNFMDGIDGLSAVEAAAIGLGLFLFGLVLGEFAVGHWQALAIAGAALGFLIWNWSPARVFLGDVGSIPIGFMLGWLLLQAASQGAWAAALILVLYYLADGTITLLRRLIQGANVLAPHRQHFYQQAVQRGHTHAKVAGLVAVLNVALIAHALIVVAKPQTATLPALLSASALVAGALAWMALAPAQTDRTHP